MFIVSRHAAEMFDKRFVGQNISADVFEAIKSTRWDNSYRIKRNARGFKTKAN